jgi:hypothetical protein
LQGQLGDAPRHENGTASGSTLESTTTTRSLPDTLDDRFRRG